MIGIPYDMFNRDMRLSIGRDSIPMQLAAPMGDSELQSMLRVAFSVERTTAKEPNTASVTVTNFAEENRFKLQIGAQLIPHDPKGDVLRAGYVWPLVIEAGYKDHLQQIFAGDITFLNSGHSGTEWETRIEAADGGYQYATKRINKSFGKGTPVAAVMLALAQALGVGLGNSAAKFANSAAFRKRFTVFKRGTTVSGLVSEQLSKYVMDLGYHWSIQDGQLQVLGLDETLLDTAVLLNKDSGMVGTPEYGEKGSITATSLLNGDLKPGRRVVIDSKNVIGSFRVEKVTHSGDTWGNDWVSHIEAKEVI